MLRLQNFSIPRNFSLYSKCLEWVLAYFSSSGECNLFSGMSVDNNLLRIMEHYTTTLWRERGRETIKLCRCCLAKVLVKVVYFSFWLVYYR